MALLHVGAFFFNGVRFLIAFAAVFTAYIITENRRKKIINTKKPNPTQHNTLQKNEVQHREAQYNAVQPNTVIHNEVQHEEPRFQEPYYKPVAWQMKVGILIGIFYSTGSNLQQIGLLSSDAGKCGFISALYILFIPFLSWIVLKKKIAAKIWLGAALAVIGLFLISAGSSFNIVTGDVMFFLAAIFYAIQIILIGHCVIYSSPLFLASMQLITCSAISMTLSVIFETGNTIEGLMAALLPVIYTGLLSLGLANLLQFVAQKKANPSVAGIIMSLESVFGAGFAAIILHERMNIPQISGCGLIFSAIIISQIERKNGRLPDYENPEKNIGKNRERSI
jgi:drug/metabolite transporter (DMT)-like permease